MNIEGLRKKLLSIVRAVPPDDRVPYAFEKRVVARLADLSIPDRWAEWSVAMWRGALTCLLTMSLLTAIAYLHARHNTIVANEEFSPDLERTMLAAVDQPREGW